MELSFKEWTQEEGWFPRNTREIMYSLVSPGGMTPAAQQKRRGYYHGKKAAENDIKHGMTTENPYRNPQGEIDPADQNFFSGWELGYNSVKKNTTAIVP